MYMTLFLTAYKAYQLHQLIPPSDRWVPYVPVMDAVASGLYTWSIMYFECMYLKPYGHHMF